MGILNLFPKKEKDLRYLANVRVSWSLLSTDYKILTKLLAIRLQKVLPTIINSDQVGYIKNRYIGENIRILSNMLQMKVGRYGSIHNWNRLWKCIRFCSIAIYV